MKDELTKRQEAFAQAYVRIRVGSRAAIEAGYSERSAMQQGSTLLSYPKVLARVKELDTERKEQLEAAIRGQAAVAIKALVDIINGTRTKGAMAAVQAANSILDRSGLKPIERLEHGGPNGAAIAVQSVFAVPLQAPDAETWALEQKPHE